MNNINFKELREEQGITQQDVRDKTGLTIATISRIENNVSQPTLENAVKILDALDFEIKIVQK